MITIGADPEFFVKKGRHFLSGHVFKCGSKYQPLQTKHGSVQVDGIALECNVRPATTRDDFVRNVRDVMSDLDAVVKHTEPDATVVARPSIYFGHRKLGSIPRINSELGCSADYNAYTGRSNPTPDRKLPIRTGAGHIHVGWTTNASPRQPKFFQECARVARQLDFYLGLPSLLWDKDDRRRTLYGKAGAFRPKPYGMEYRVLSNAWLGQSNLVGFVFDAAVQAVSKVFEDDLLEVEYGDLAREYINNNDPSWADTHPELADWVLT